MNEAKPALLARRVGRAATLLGLFLLAACETFVPAHAWHDALENQRNIGRVHLGQTLVEVEKIMGKPPERRSTRLRFDGLSIEEWSYVTNYVRRNDTAITFVGGKVNEIRVVPWEEKD